MNKWFTIGIFSTIILACNNTGDSQTESVYRGTQTEKRSDSSTYGQEYFSYKNGMKTYKLKKNADNKSNIFLSVPGYQRWVYGEDYQYDDVKNEIQFLKSPPCIYEIGGTRSRTCLHDGDIVWAFYLPKEEISTLRSKYGENVSIEAASFMSSIQAKDVSSIKVKFFPQDKKVTVFRTFSGASSESYFYGADADAVYHFLLNKGVQEKR